MKKKVLKEDFVNVKDLYKSISPKRESFNSYSKITKVFRDYSHHTSKLLHKNKMSCKSSKLRNPFVSQGFISSAPNSNSCSPVDRTTVKLSIFEKNEQKKYFQKEVLSIFKAQNSLNTSKFCSDTKQAPSQSRYSIFPRIPKVKIRIQSTKNSKLRKRKLLSPCRIFELNIL